LNVKLTWNSVLPESDYLIKVVDYSSESIKKYEVTGFKIFVDQAKVQVFGKFILFDF
jgi:hypothetical protein